MLKQLIAKGTVNVESKIRSLPRTFNLGDFYSGAGTFFLVVEAVVKAFQVVAPNPAEDLEASKLICFFFPLQRCVFFSLGGGNGVCHAFCIHAACRWYINWCLNGSRSSSVIWRHFCQLLVRMDSVASLQMRQRCSVMIVNASGTKPAVSLGLFVFIWI